MPHRRPDGRAGAEPATRFKGGKSGPAIVPGDPEKSLLIQAVAQTHERLKMPPGGKLTDAEIADLRDLDQGRRGLAAAAGARAAKP